MTDKPAAPFWPPPDAETLPPTEATFDHSELVMAGPRAWTLTAFDFDMGRGSIQTYFRNEDTGYVVYGQVITGYMTPVDPPSAPVEPPRRPAQVPPVMILS